MFALISIGDVVIFAGGFAVAWLFKDRIVAFIAKVRAKL